MQTGRHHSQTASTRPEAFFSECCDAFRQACQAAGGPTIHHIRIAGHTVELTFAGGAMEPVLMPALSHLAVEDTNTPDLTVRIWDHASTGVGIPRRPWNSSDCLPYNGGIRGFDMAPIQGSFQAPYNSLSLYNDRDATAVFWMYDAQESDCHLAGSPLRHILHWASHRWGLQMLHAACVGIGSGAALIVGRGGSGKSTTALSCLGSDLRYLGDDIVIVRIDDPLEVWSAYRAGKLSASHLAFFPDLMSRAAVQDNLGDRKAIIYTTDREMGPCGQGLLPRAILVPKVGSTTDCTLDPISPGAALRALAPSTLVLLPGGEDESLRRMGALAARVPAYRLTLGRRIDQIPKIISRLLAGGPLTRGGQ